MIRKRFAFKLGTEVNLPKIGIFSYDGKKISMRIGTQTYEKLLSAPNAPLSTYNAVLQCGVTEYPCVIEIYQDPGLDPVGYLTVEYSTDPEETQPQTLDKRVVVWYQMPRSGEGMGTGPRILYGVYSSPAMLARHKDDPCAVLTLEEIARDPELRIKPARIEIYCPEGFLEKYHGTEFPGERISAGDPLPDVLRYFFETLF